MKFFFRSSKATVWAIFAVLAFQAFWVNFSHIRWGFAPDFYPWLAGILVISIIYLIALYFARKNKTIHLIAFSFFIVIIAARLFWVRYFDAEQVSDFATYWNVGHSIVVDGLAQQSSRGIYLLRSIFYTAPIQYLFGNNQQYLELVNVFLVIISMLIFYDFGRRVFSAKIAAVALLFFSWNPDIWYGVTLADHDIAFLPWLAGLCWVIYWLDKKLHNKPFISIPVVILLSIAAGILIFGLEAQRGFGLPALLALILLLFYYLYHQYREYKAQRVNDSLSSHIIKKNCLKNSFLIILVILIIPLGTYELSFFTITQAIGVKKGSDTVPNISTKNLIDESNSLPYLSAKDVFGSDRYSEMLPWRRLYTRQLPVGLRNDFNIKKFLSEEFSDPVETLKQFFRKNAVLADPTGTLGFSSHPSEHSWVGRTNSENVGMQEQLNRLLSAILFFLLFLRLMLYPFFTIKRGGFFLIIFTTVFYLSIILFTEAQPRYDVFTVFLVGLLVAQLIIDFKELRLNGKKRSDSIKTPEFYELKKERSDEND
jgi:hypothetical protein